MELWAESLRVEEVAASVATAMAQLRAEELPRVTPLHRVPDRAERPLNLQRPAASMLRLMPPARFVESEARAVRTWALAGEATQLAAAQWAALAGWRVARSWWCPTRMARSVVVEGRTRLRASHRSVGPIFAAVRWRPLGALPRGFGCGPAASARSARFRSALCPMRRVNEGPQRRPHSKPVRGERESGTSSRLPLMKRRLTKPVRF